MIVGPILTIISLKSNRPSIFIVDEYKRAERMAFLTGRIDPDPPLNVLASVGLLSNPQIRLAQFTRLKKTAWTPWRPPYNFSLGWLETDREGDDVPRIPENASPEERLRIRLNWRARLYVDEWLGEQQVRSEMLSWVPYGDAILNALRPKKTKE